MKKLGIDTGSTTLKCVLLSEEDEILYKSYERHFSKITETLGKMLQTLSREFQGERFLVSLSGSAGMGIAEHAELPFVQEVFAEQIAVKNLAPGTDVVIELGGEDAKILFLTGGFEMRMNGTCAGGTGAFIDQMSTLMNITPDEMNELSKVPVRKFSMMTSACFTSSRNSCRPSS